MELRPAASHKENVPPRPATPLRPEQWRLPKSLGVGLGSGQGQWVPTCQRGGPGVTPSPGAVLGPEPWQVQTNLASPWPRPGLALKDSTGLLTNSGSRQQSNMQPRVRRPQGGALESAVQQSNLSVREAGLGVCGSPSGPRLWSDPQERGPCLGLWESPLPQGSLTCPPSTLGLAQLLTTDTPCLGFRPAAGFASLDGHTQLNPRSWCGLGSRTCRLLVEPLTLEDLAVHAPSQAPAPSQAAVHRLLVSVRCLELEVARLRHRESQEPPDSAKQGPWASDGRALPASHRPCQLALASRDEKKYLRGLRETGGFPETQGVQAGRWDSKASGKPTSPETTLELLTGGSLDPEQGVLPTQPLRRGESHSPGPPYAGGQRRERRHPVGVSSREARLCSSASCSMALPGPEGGEGARGLQISTEEERTASCLPDAAAARSDPQDRAQHSGSLEAKAAGLKPESCPALLAVKRGILPKGLCVWDFQGAPEEEGRSKLVFSLLQGPHPAMLERHQGWCPGPWGPAPWGPDQLWSVPSRQLLSRCFRAWWCLVQKQQAVGAALVLSQQQRLHRGLRALRWALRLREAQLEAAWTRHTRTLLAWSFQKWRNMTLQQKQGQTHIQAGLSPSGPGQGQGSPGRKPAVDLAQRGSTGSLREEAGARRLPLHLRPRPGGGARRSQTLQALQQLAVFLLWCHQKERARPEQRGQGESSWATRRTQSLGRPPQARRPPAADVAWVAPLATWSQRAWMCRCFRAWQRFLQRGIRYRHHLAACCTGALRMSLQQWVKMKQLRASDGAKVTQLSLCRQKAGNTVLRSSILGAATAYGPGTRAQARGLPQQPGGGSLQEACQRLALHRALLLWKTRLSQRQQKLTCLFQSQPWVKPGPRNSPVFSCSSFFQGLWRRTLRGILRGWHLRVWGLGTVPGSAGTTSALESLGSCSTSQSSLEKASRAPALLDTLRVNFLQAARRRQQGQCLLLWQARAQQSRGAARWHQHSLQRRIILGWSHWAMTHRARRELAARLAWGRSYRAVLGVWRLRLTQRRELEQWAWVRGRRLARDALGRWRACWQRQQFLHDKYQRWVQGHLQGWRRALFWGWRQAAARRRHTVARPEPLLMQSCLQAWCGLVRDRGVLGARCGTFRDGLRTRAPGATSATWKGTRVAAAAGALEQRVAQASVARWRSHVQGRQAERQLRRAQAQQAFVAWRVALGQRREAHQRAEEQAQAQARMALCWTLWVREACQCRLSRAHAARRLSARVLEAWAQSAARGGVLRATLTQFQQAGPKRLLRTHWAQWQTVLLMLRLERGAEAQEVSTAHPRPWSRQASREHQLALMDTPALWKQPHPAAPPTRPTAPSREAGSWRQTTPNRQQEGGLQQGTSLDSSRLYLAQIHSCRPPAPEPLLPGPAQHHSLCGQREWRETSWEQSKETLPRTNVSSAGARWLPASSGLEISFKFFCILLTPPISFLNVSHFENAATFSPAPPVLLFGQLFRTSGSWGGVGWGGVTVLLLSAPCPASSEGMAVLGRCSGDGAAGSDAAQAVAAGVGLENMAAAGPAAAGGSAIQQQEDDWLLSQAFGKWRQSLAARSPGKGAASSGCCYDLFP
ncbi:LOW QUALITY PROTEIN: uncharacterized protein C1orf167 homolog [Talpa occidentalis]|uniref:LOW QUALITY PROTEIN: uncharacterized protein C1orf167 homolog n=1 Tax=Talpa occidentalis TaxID=50954 RepID=UPI0023F90278|nr:LOW QUALITY PROTEIN: uncharacterized protein C1orf167 homolog [Talpa occidentalis]